MKICKSCGKNFDQNLAKEYVEVHDLSLPSYCKLCSWKRKLSFENEYNVYKRTCDATGKTIVSVYKDSKYFPVYDRNYWIKDDWNLPEISYDKNRPFLEQYFELYKKVPRPSANCVNAENSEYANLVFDSKNCYLSFQVFLSEKVIGCYRVVRMRDSVNCFFCTESELLCECANCHKCYGLKFSEDCEDCSDSAFLFDCKGCRNCFMSFNLRNKQYYFRNEKLSKEEYERVIKEFDLSNQEKKNQVRASFESLRDQFIVKASHQINCEKCFGDYLVNSKNCSEIYFSDGCQDSLNILRGTEDINSFDAVVGGKIELCYNVLQPGYSYKCAFSISCNHCNETYLSEYCDYCDSCLGCISLKHGKNCILNKRYGEEEYKNLKAYIFNELKEGNKFEEFFNPKFSPFDYGETIADLYFPKVGFEEKVVQSREGECEFCGCKLQFADAEKSIYEKVKVALPSACFNCRIQKLSRSYSVTEMEVSNCEKCEIEVYRGKNFRKFGRLYCEKCYLKEVY